MSNSQSPDPDRRVVDEDLGDLFEEAPVAYVHEDMDTRFIRANRAAREILGISAEEVSRTIGTSLVVDTPEAKQNVRDALERLRIGGRTVRALAASLLVLCLGIGLPSATAGDDPNTAKGFVAGQVYQFGDIAHVNDTPLRSDS